MKSSFWDVVSVNCLTFCKGSSEKPRGRQNVKINIFFLTSPGAKTQYWLDNSKSSHGTNCKTIPLQHASAAQRDNKSKAGRPRAFPVKNVKINIFLTRPETSDQVSWAKTLYSTIVKVHMEHTIICKCSAKRH